MSPISAIADVRQVIITIRLVAVSINRHCTNLDVYCIQYVKYDILDHFILMIIIAVMLVGTVVVPVLVLIPLLTPNSANVYTRPIIMLPVGIVSIIVC